MKHKNVSIISFSEIIPNTLFPVGRIEVKEVHAERIKKAWESALFFRKVEEHFPFALFFEKIFKEKISEGEEEKLFKMDLHEATLSKGESLIVISGKYNGGYKFAFKEYTII
jgi:hypothetical protein